jgi:hypothetical protein
VALLARNVTAAGFPGSGGFFRGFPWVQVPHNTIPIEVDEKPFRIEWEWVVCAH